MIPWFGLGTAALIIIVFAAAIASGLQWFVAHDRMNFWDWLLMPVSLVFASWATGLVEYMYVKNAYGFAPVMYWGPHLPGNIGLWYFSVAGLTFLILTGAWRLVVFLFNRKRSIN